MGSDVSLGELADLATYTSNGTANATETAKAPDQLEPTCWIRNIQNTCNDDQKLILQQGHGAIINGVLYNDASDWKDPPLDISMSAGFPGNGPLSTTTTGAVPTAVTTTTDALTGVFTATSTPRTTKKGAASRLIKVRTRDILLGVGLAIVSAFM